MKERNRALMTVVAIVLCTSCAREEVGLSHQTKAAGAPAGRVKLTEVKIDGVPGQVRKAEFVVPENPAKSNGRMLTIVALILAADGGGSPRDPVLVFQGGPGQSATDLADFYAQFFARVRTQRDIVLLDQRGTGKSGALMASVPPGRLTDELGSIIPASWIAPTLLSLQGTVDLTQYTTRRIVDDAEGLIDALGYREVNLYGTSYGTRCALDFMRRYPKRVRTSLIKNVLPPRGIIPLSYAANTQRAFDLLLADIEADAEARAQYPNLRLQLDGLLRRLDAAPARVRVSDPPAGPAQEVVLTRAGVAATIRNMLMTPQTRATIPYIIDRASSGALDELAAQMAQYRGVYARTLALGMTMSVVASEDCPRLTPELIRQDTSASFLGDAVLASFQNVCAAWPRAVVEPELFRPVRSDIPTLVVSGRMDPATPPAWGEEVARSLPNSRHVVFRYAAHPNSGFAGLDDLVASFIASGTVKGLDTSCAEKGTALPFRSPAR